MDPRHFTPGFGANAGGYSPSYAHPSRTLPPIQHMLQNIPPQNAPHPGHPSLGGSVIYSRSNASAHALRQTSHVPAPRPSARPVPRNSSGHADDPWLAPTQNTMDYTRFVQMQRPNHPVTSQQMPVSYAQAVHSGIVPVGRAPPLPSPSVHRPKQGTQPKPPKKAQVSNNTRPAPLQWQDPVINNDLVDAALVRRQALSVAHKTTQQAPPDTSAPPPSQPVEVPASAPPSATSFVPSVGASASSTIFKRKMARKEAPPNQDSNDPLRVLELDLAGSSDNAPVSDTSPSLPSQVSTTDPSPSAPVPPVPPAPAEASLETSPPADSTSDPKSGTQKKVRMGTKEKEVKEKLSRNKRLNLAIIAQLSDERAKRKKIAGDNHVKERTVERKAARISSITEAKAPSAYNALYAIKAEELRLEAHARGDKAPSMAEVHARLRADKVLMAKLNDVKERKRLEDEAKDKRQDRAVRARNSRRGEATEANKTMVRLHNEAYNVWERGSISVVGICTRTAFDQSVEAGVFGRGPFADFLKEKFDVSIWDFAGMYEGFVCEWTAKGTRAMSANEKKADAVKHLTEGLVDVTGGKCKTMSFKHFDTHIKEKFKVDLVGWPDDVPFLGPHDLNMGQVHTLHDALVGGVCKWKKMQAYEFRIFKQQLDKDRDGGVVSSGRRATRSDKGKKHKQPAAKSSRPSKKQRKTLDNDSADETDSDVEEDDDDEGEDEEEDDDDDDDSEEDELLSE
ncbi:hypothetical protein VNI00_008985 [Paramarasmius palmivorus]|uniref:Uncharacterized protein n=1 Tax=Paramarasmius palmivorus TaxID=297713 RepID=A0AAW0CTR9_9AGAR